MLDDTLKTQLAAYLQRLTDTVEIVASLDEREASREMRELLDEIAALSPLIRVRHDGQDARRPSFSISRAGHDMGVRFAAIPMGHEFTSLVLALLQAGGHPPKLEQEVIEQIRSLEGEFSLRDLHVAHLPQLPGRRAGAEPDGGAQPAHPPRRDRRRAVQGRSRGAPDHGGADDLPERPAVRLRPHGDRRDPREDRHRRGRARCEEAGGEGRVRRADRRRRTRRRGGRRVRGAQGHPHRHRGRAPRRPDAGHARHRELHLGAGDRGTEVRRGAGSACAPVRRRHHRRPAGRVTAARGYAGWSDHGHARQRRAAARAAR